MTNQNNKKPTQRKRPSFAKKSGRPPKFETPEQLQKAIDNYFKSLTDEDKPTITGLCIHTGFASRQSFYDMEKRDGFAYTIKKARLFIEHEYEQMLRSGNTVGAIFALKNFGWVDRQTLDISADSQLQAILKALPEKYALQVQAALVSLAKKPKQIDHNIGD